MTDALDINRLSRETGVNLRTIRYYLAEKLLPPPVGRGPGAVYGAGHRDRLRLIRRWQDDRLPLAEIRERLGRLDDAGVAAALAGGRTRGAAPVTNGPAPPRPDLTEPGTAPASATGGHPPSADSAADYVRRVLGHGAAAGPPASPAPPAASSPAGQTPVRSTWERIPLTPEIELHVRRPLGRADQRRLETLLAHAARLFDGGN